MLINRNSYRPIQLKRLNDNCQRIKERCTLLKERSNRIIEESHIIRVIAECYGRNRRVRL